MGRIVVIVGSFAVWIAATPLLASPPAPLSPQGVVELRCPTFSWSQATHALGYELVVFAVSEDGEVAEIPVVSTRLPAGASSWTPPGAGCLEAGGRYAWSVRAVGGDGAGGGSEAILFRVAAAPSPAEVESAIETLRRYLEEARGGEGVIEEAGSAQVAAGEQWWPGEAVATRLQEAGDSHPDRGGLDSPTPASVPSLGSPSLAVDANVALGAASNLFKDGSVFLWDDDTTGNTALGRLALFSAAGNATNNTAVGREALRNTVWGFFPDVWQGSDNTGIGSFALWSNTTGAGNTASGSDALFSSTTGSWNTASGNGALFFNTTGRGNTAIGYWALRVNTTGHRNTAVGDHAGRYATTGHDNIFVGSGAVETAEEGNTIRVGGETGTGPFQQNRAFIAGIRGITTGENDAVPVVIDSAGQLGTVSSSRRAKQDIREVGELSRRLLELRPVAFRYRVHAEADPATPLQFGLIAEEVAEVFPELVVYDREGRPETVKYHLLAALLLAELQREERELAKQRAELERAQGRLDAQQRELSALQESLTALERDGPGEERRRWWRRSGHLRESP
jgi:hypothetical protein